MGKRLSYWIKERHNPQFDKPYYVAEGQMTKKAAYAKERGGVYGFNLMLEYESEEGYEAELKRLEAEGYSVRR